jgi:hypothetical protein
MHVMTLICLTIAQLARQAWALPQSAAAALRRRRQQIIQKEFEAERLDRIRNPSNYLGK